MEAMPCIAVYAETETVLLTGSTVELAPVATAANEGGLISWELELLTPLIPFTIPLVAALVSLV